MEQYGDLKLTCKRREKFDKISGMEKMDSWT